MAKIIVKISKNPVIIKKAYRFNIKTDLFYLIKPDRDRLYILKNITVIYSSNIIIIKLLKIISYY